MNLLIYLTIGLIFETIMYFSYRGIDGIKSTIAYNQLSAVSELLYYKWDWNRKISIVASVMILLVSMVADIFIWPVNLVWVIIYNIYKSFTSMWWW